MELEPEKSKKRIEIILKAILLIFSLGTLALAYYFNSLYSIVCAYFISILCLSVFLAPFKDKIIIKQYLFLTGWVLGIIYILSTIFLSFLLIYLSGLLVLALFIALFNVIVSGLSLFNFGIDREAFKTSILYCSVLVAAVILSYFGERVITLVHKLLSIGATNKSAMSRDLALKIYKEIEMKRRVYELSILLYIVTVVERLSNISIISATFWANYKLIALEVLITFVAIDAYIRNFSKNTPQKTINDIMRGGNHEHPKECK